MSLPDLPRFLPVSIFEVPVLDLHVGLLAQLGEELLRVLQPAVAAREVRGSALRGLGPVAVHWSVAVRGWAAWPRVPRRAVLTGGSAGSRSGAMARSWSSSAR
jgi:hypothetical protein